MESFGFVGHPNAGKSSLFNVLTGAKVLAAPYPFATLDANVGVAVVPDSRLDRLVEMSSSVSVVPTHVGFTDIGGLVKGASEGEGLGNQFLSAIREVDAIVYILRAFQSKDLPPPDPPVEQLEILEVELALADLDSAEKQLEKRRRKTKAEKTKDDGILALEMAIDSLKTGVPIYRSDLDEITRENLAQSFLLTNKPVMAVLNVDEARLEEPSHWESEVSGVSQALGGSEVISICVELEAEAMDFSREERVELLSNLGIPEDALTQLLQSAYRLLDLKTFFTTGPKETRAWTYPAGATAPQCAGLIHSDMERGFIRADCIQAEELLKHGSLQAAKDAGKVAGVGRDYEVQDGDTMEIRFNV